MQTLDPFEEKLFKRWLKVAGTFDSDDYDMRAYFKEKFLQGQDESDNRGHYPDTYKLPNHPTFSNESKYADPDESRMWMGNMLIDSNTGETIADERDLGILNILKNRRKRRNYF